MSRFTEALISPWNGWALRALDQIALMWPPVFVDCLVFRSGLEEKKHLEWFWKKMRHEFNKVAFTKICGRC